ncbi:ATP-binding protein [Aureimonas endophytica]|uniref:ATP-binding protein n=1 Tax=Aureimonas endophytica TaxID=2027858 RepID=A0A917E8C1_9HYPH|nr:cell wall hydrolase [Aureimonas endophytica]GGE14871.1 ATP-binding protein [Aureimonas endophytica]
MTTRTKARRAAGRVHLPARLRRPAGLALAALAALPFLSIPLAHGDMTSLLEGQGAKARWQAFFVPSPAGAIEAASLGLAGGGAARLPAGVGIADGAGSRYRTQAAAPDFDTPDEMRVNRREKRGRVLAVTPFAPPKAFSAGSILERQSLLAPPAAGDAPIETAFLRREGAEDATGELAVAMNFAPTRAAVPLPEPAPAVMVASLTTRSPKLAPAVPETTALGYAAPEAGRSGVAAVFGRILRGGAGTGFVPPIGRDDHAWAAAPLPPEVFSAKEQLCLANGIYFEARGESETGQAAVGQVILNRVRNPTYPKTICGVVYQNQDWRNRCQFSFACDGIRKRVTNKRAFSTALRIAGEVTRGETWLADVGSATHYHATYVRPRWASAMKEVDKIGRHIFYRTYGGGWN